MQLNDPLICAPTLEEAIDHQPLIVAPDTLLIDVIALMSQERGKTCSLPNFHSPSDQISIREPRSSCVLVMHFSYVHQSSRSKDDYSANVVLRNAFRKRKKAEQREEAAAKARGIHVKLVAENPQDISAAGKVKFRDRPSAVLKSQRHKADNAVVTCV